MNKQNAARSISNLIYNDIIKRNILNVGMPIPTVRELTKKYAPISITTIANALNILEHDGYIEKKQGKGCYISDRRSNQKFIGIIPSIEDNYDIALKINKGINKVIQNENIHLIMSSASRISYEEEKRELEKMISLKCQAIILYPYSRSEEELKNDFLKTKYKDQNIIIIDNAYFEQKRSCVIFDNYSAGYDMTNYLIQKGHKNILFVRQELEGNLWKSIDDRYDGYIDALNNNDININSFIRLNPIYISNLSDYPSNDQIEEYLINWKKLKDRPTAIIALHDGVAMSIIIIAQKLGINIPEDLEVVGFDNLSISQNFTPSFTTTNPDFEKAGEVATRIALKQIREGFEYPQNYVLPVPLLIR